MPGVRIRFLPRASARLISLVGVLGLASKNVERGMDRPASWPLAQDGPDELCWTAGMKTSKPPCEFEYRNGFSWVTVLVGRTVFCWHWPPNTGAGAPTTPT